MFGKKSTVNRLERLTMAVTFAEANQHDMALEMIEYPANQGKRKRVRRKARNRDEERPVLMA